jgi:hypothetical protein
MHSLLTFLYHMNNTSFFLFLISFGGFRQESYASMWGHYGSKIMGVFLRPLSKVSSLITDIFWWYKPFLYEGLCPICFFGELGFSGSVFMLWISYFL